MIRLCVTLIVLGEVYTTHANAVVQPNLTIAAAVGETVTLTCIHPTDDFSSIIWFRHTIGQQPQYIVGTYRHSTNYSFYSGFKDTQRFTSQKEQGMFNLRISKIQASDSAIYYCAAVYSIEVKIGAGTFLTLKGSQSNSRTVVQQPVSEPLQSGDSVTLQCTIRTQTCAGEHSVYWFRQGSGESSPGIIYTHGNSSDQCERSSGAGSPTQSCVYKLPKRNLSPSDAGTYYCAVATCGEILFGNGTRLDVQGDAYREVLVYVAGSLGLSLALCLTVIFRLVCTRNNRPHCQHCEGGSLHQTHQDTSHEERSKVQGCAADSLHYAALNHSGKRVKAEQQRRQTEGDTVYSDVRSRGWE
ncbi:hypothetical protein MATL_G00175330 [Megalops atlanticus]|uniref:Ig-like domain-containing protein n=1 Tax=Megalops atlanticus TaxID=7932 RepID=A0A9D3PRW6_MEGAT|nr:hypothetical protein MATL_G00175330 [Megalops atlanticus]